MKKNSIQKLFVFFLVSLFLSACANTQHHSASVVDGWQQKPVGSIQYVVQSSDTLYSIAWGFGADYRAIAKVNNLVGPAYPVKVGQKLSIIPNYKMDRENNMDDTASTTTTEAATTAVARPVPTNKQPITEQSNAVAATTTPATAAPVTAEPVSTVSSQVANVGGVSWGWPAQGKVIDTFSATSLNKGIDIVGKMGAPVLAAANGKVVYAGGGLRGYGQLIIIKNSDEFLSAYAHNQSLMVKEGQIVKQGQLIAHMGNTEARQVALHFEIRKAGKPVDPLDYLPSYKRTAV